jgi:radical SAM protein with 4Fe4S-binding SPASM domain
MPLAEESYAHFTARIFERTAGERPRPTACQFEITYRCNIHCVHCYTDPFNTPMQLRQELSYEQIVGLLDQLAAAGVLWLLLTGGEAFLHPRFRDIYQAAKARGFVITLFSNATVLTDGLIDFLAEDPPFKIEVSLHGATRETFERITQVPGSFDRCITGLRKMAARGLPLKVKTKAMTLNHEELPAIRNLVESLGLQFNLYTSIFPRLNGDISSTDYRLSGAEIVDLEFAKELEDGDRCQPAVADDEAIPTTPPNDRLFRCGCGTNSFTISPYGMLRACTFTTQPTYDLKTISFEDAFNRMVEAIQNARYSGESPCRTCTAYVHCEKNPVSAQHETGSMEAPVPHFCDVAFSRQAKIAALAGKP